MAASLLGLTAERLRQETFRTASGQEVDFLLESDAGAIAGIEVKASATVTGHDFNGLRALAEMTQSRFHRGLVLYAGSEIVPFGAHLYALPVDSLWNGKPTGI